KPVLRISSRAFAPTSVYQAERMRPLRPDEDVSPASVLAPQPSDAHADLLDAPVSCSVIASLSFETPISKRSRRENNRTSTTPGSCRQFCRPRMVWHRTIRDELT